MDLFVQDEGSPEIETYVLGEVEGEFLGFSLLYALPDLA